MNLNDITSPLTQEQINGLSVDQCRERMKLIVKAAARNDFDWSFDENLMLTERIPEEKQAQERAFKKQRRVASNRKYRM